MLTQDLEQFYGTMAYHRLGDKSIVLTDGVAYFMKRTGCSDLMLHILDVLESIFKSGEDFVSMTIESGSLGVTVTYTDGDYKKVAPIEVHAVQGIDEGEYNFFCCDNVLMLASEY